MLTPPTHILRKYTHVRTIHDVMVTSTPAVILNSNFPPYITIRLQTSEIIDPDEIIKIFFLAYNCSQMF